MKSRHDTRVGRTARAGAGEAQAAPDALTGFAEDLGRFLGDVQNRASSWLEQRKAIATQLTQIRDTANQYLNQLSEGAADFTAAVQRGRRGQPAGTRDQRGSHKAAATAKKNQTMSAEARRRTSEAQKSRGTKQRKR
jgi:hypothetical protein